MRPQKCSREWLPGQEVSDVAARVAVTEPVIFQNSGSKAALYAAVLDRVVGQTPRVERAVHGVASAEHPDVTAQQASIVTRMGILIRQDPAPADLILDALLGYGLHENPRGRIAELIGRAAARPGSLDGPSGLDLDTGRRATPGRGLPEDLAGGGDQPPSRCRSSRRCRAVAPDGRWPG